MFAKSKNTVRFTILVLSLFVLFFADLITGPVGISLNDVLRFFIGNGSDTSSSVLYNFRLPKALAAVFVGASLSVGGLQMQTVFKNPLADPYILGISAGSGLGVALFLMGSSSFALAEHLRSLGIYAAAFIGAMAVLFIVIAVSAKVRNILSILILGVMFGSAISAFVSILQYFSSETMLKTYVVWTMGSLGTVSFDKMWLMFLSLIIGLSLSVYSIKPLNALLLGDNYAKSMGVNIKLHRNLVFLSTGILTGTATAFCGPIGFIGIAVPHIVRMFFRQSNHKVLIPAVILTGASVMLFCDIAAQIIAKGMSLPINSITALLGIPVIILVILRHGKR